jgi:hypothetical protein
MMMPVRTLGLEGPPADTVYREIIRSNERALKVKVDFAFGTLFLSKGTDKKIATVKCITEEGEKEGLRIQYEIEDGLGVLVIESKEKEVHHGSRRGWEISKKTWIVQLNDNLPMGLDVQVGAGEGDIDLSGLKLNNIKLSSGASSVEIRCDDPNMIRAENVIIESGASSFKGYNLANMNFTKMKFSGGVGDYVLDFGGNLTRDASVKIELGLGAMVLSVPKTTTATIVREGSFLSTFNIDHSFVKTDDDIYETTSGNGNNVLKIKVESGLGSVRVKRK